MIPPRLDRFSRTDDFTLQVPAGKGYIPAAAPDAAMRLDGSAGESWIYAFGYWGERMRSAQKQANADRRVDFATKEFRAATLRTGEAAHGFLFYLIPDDIRELRNPSLVVKGTDDLAATSVSVELPLGDLGAW